MPSTNIFSPSILNFTPTSVNFSIQGIKCSSFTPFIVILLLVIAAATINVPASILSYIGVNDSVSFNSLTPVIVILP